MTGSDFERYIAEFFKENGFWALRIPKDKRGAQPFDIIAISRDSIYAVDCKVCAKGLFSINRIEDNQWVSMEVMTRRTNAIVGFVIFRDGKVFFVEHKEAKEVVESGRKSIKLDENHIFKLKGAS